MKFQEKDTMDGQSRTYLSSFSFFMAHDDWKARVLSRKLMNVLQSFASALYEAIDFESSSSWVVSSLYKSLNTHNLTMKQLFQPLNYPSLQKSSYPHAEMWNNLITSFFKLISFFLGIVKAGLSRSQGSINLHINSLDIIALSGQNLQMDVIYKLSKSQHMMFFYDVWFNRK